MTRFAPQSIRFIAVTGSLALLLAASCAKSKSEQNVEPKKVETAVPSETKTPEEDKAAADAKKVAERLAEFEVEQSTEEKRWSDKLVAEAKAVVDSKYKSPQAAIEAAIAGSHRKPGNSDRDIYRHPLKTLLFFGLKPSSRVVEMGVGGGWYTELLAPVVARSGLYIGGAHNPDGPKDSMQTFYGIRAKAFFGMSKDLYGNAKTFDPGADDVVIGEPESADLVLAIREMHGWQRRGLMDAMLEAAAKVLKPGGILGIVQHRAKADAKVEESAEKGYLPEAWVIETVEAKGFKLVEKSEINANAKDTKDYPEGVWTLPPSYRLGETDKEKYEAIGESDRMTLKFKKL